MSLPVSPSGSFPVMLGSPTGTMASPAGNSGSDRGGSGAVGGMVVLSGSMNWEPVRQRLLGPDLKDALQAATELREGIEIVHTVEFPLMLSALLPAFSSILGHRTSPSPDTSTTEHKLRNVVLEIISRMPSNEILRPHAPHLVAVALDTLNRDYEENALLASRIIFDLYKVYRSLPQDYVQPYLDFVLNSYRTLPTSVQRNFLFNALVTGPSSSSSSLSQISPSWSRTGPSLTAGTTAVPAVRTPGAAATNVKTPPQPTKGASMKAPTTTGTTLPTAIDSTTPSASTTPAQSPLTSKIKSPPKTAATTASTSATPINRAAGAEPISTPPPIGSTPTPATFTTPPPFKDSNNATPAGTPMAKIPTSPVPRLSPKSNSSFRVLTECPLVVMLMFQLYPKFLRSNIPALINVMMEALALRAPPLHAISHAAKATTAVTPRPSSTPRPISPQKAAQGAAAVQVASATTSKSPLNRTPEAPTPNVATKSKTPKSSQKITPKAGKSTSLPIAKMPSSKTAATAATSTNVLDANARRLYFSRCRELVAAQAKTLSFLTYLLRGFSNDLKPYEDRLASNVVALMSTCPREFISTRKELLVATRHLLNSEFRNGFFRHVDALLDERVLMGSHHRYSEQTILRPLGFTTLSDLVHHVRTKLNMNQISRVISIFSRVLHDSSRTLPMSTQYTAVRTLLSVVDMVFQNRDRNPQIGRDMLVRVLKTLVDKLGAIHACRQRHRTTISTVTKSLPSSMTQTEGGSTQYRSSTNSLLEQLELPVGSDPKESLRDLKGMIHAVIVGHKKLIWCINNYRAQREKEKIEGIVPPMPGSNEEVASAMLKITHTEHALIDKYIKLAFPCMKWLKEEEPSNLSVSSGSTLASGKAPNQHSNSGHSSKKAATLGERSAADQYRDVLTYFAAAFTTLDGYDLRRTLGRRLEQLVEAVADEPAAIVVPRHLLAANATTSFEFCSILLNFLVERMGYLAVPCTMSSSSLQIEFLPPATDCDKSEIDVWRDLHQTRETNNTAAKQQKQIGNFVTEEITELAMATKIASAHLQLFERVLKSLTSFPENERALRPHLRHIVSTCLRASMEKSEFKLDNYCMLLRYVFRSISAGKFEESYRELLPLIPTVLNGLFRVFRATDDNILHHTIIELLLTIPARLSSLLPHMNILLRIIISALESESGDLVNLGLRTLEFWVDNLNPEFLFPELSKQTELFIRLMKGLSTHLRPAPYPYGLLTLRLLGKLGGKNRRVLREPMDVKDPASFENHAEQLSIECVWLESKFTEEMSDDVGTSEKTEKTAVPTALRFSLPIPIHECVQILQRLILLPETSQSSLKSTETVDQEPALLWKDSEKLWEITLEDTNLLPYCLDATAKTKTSQAESALRVLQAALNEMISTDFPELNSIDMIGNSAMEESPSVANDDYFDIQLTTSTLVSYNRDFESVALGLMLGCAIESVREKSLSFARGFLTHIYLIIVSHHKCFIRIDANGSSLTTPTNGNNGQLDSIETTSEESTNDIFEDGLGSLKPFGYFELTGPLKHSTNPLTMNKSLADFLSQPSLQAREAGLVLLRHLLELPKSLEVGKENKEKPKYPGDLDRGSIIVFESLLSSLCQQCVATMWNRREALYEGICLVLRTLGVEWSRKYEIEVMNVAFFSLKSAPKEMSMAAVKAFAFVLEVCSVLYGEVKRPDDIIIVDIFARKANGKEDKASSEATGKMEVDEEIPVVAVEALSLRTPSDEVLEILISEIASTKHSLRLASRYVIKQYVIDALPKDQCYEKFRSQLPLIKRVLFSRSLRLLPLPEQVGAVEALAVIVDQLPELIPLNDQHLLAFLSELLKMSSVADGEMTDPNLVGSVVDKNGYAVSTHDSSNLSNKETKTKHYENPSSALFLRRDCILSINQSRIHIPRELPTGVQLRVSSINLLRAVIRGHSNPFFDAESSTPVGNIRPHVISLLFRSLVSFPLKAVIASHDALRDVLSLSVISEGGKSKSRLRKELLQTCIRPVLLNLRDYTRLSVHLLRGLSRLLSLLSSWFNKTLGEKLLDHLQKWTDPNRMRAQKIWREGEEPDVAAAIIDLFVLLPHASHFVEPLVKTTIKLEACLPVFKSRHSLSPFRRPLAKYLNKHCQYTVTFFLQRLKTPLYSEIFQDLIKFPESKPLRDYLSGRHCSVSLLNVCFERPLAIIRSEKTASSPGQGGLPTKAVNTLKPKEILHLHGIQPFILSPTQKESALKRDVDTKKKKLQLLHQEVVRTKDILVKSTASAGAPAASDIEEVKRKHKIAKAAYDRGHKEFNDSKQKYTAEMALAKATQKPASVKDKGGTRPMSIEALELYHQGLRLIWTLISEDQNYLKEHNDVLRAFRWLWRSKGRYLRVQHEDCVSPRYHTESKLLASILVDYSLHFPSDVDLLFELIRIFLQSSADDFSFVRTFLADAVAKLSAEQKRQIIQRFFALLAGESTEEIKTLSVQLVVYPMLHASLREEKNSIYDVDSSTESTNARSSKFEIIDASMPQRFVTEVLFSKGKQIQCGDRLKVELLKMTNLLLEFMPLQMKDLEKDIVSFCWSLLRSEDASCKSWAYLVLCRHISVMETSSKIILQVYVALIRSHQPEGKDIVRAALDLLVPAMNERLSQKEKNNAIEYTNRTMFEEVNSMQQLAHIWHTVVNHPSTFYSNRHQFVRYMVNSLTRLGLPPNSPSENRTLSVSVIDLVMQWNHDQKVNNTPSDAGAKRTLDENDFDERQSGKKRKTTSGTVLISSKQIVELPPLLDQTMVDTMLNFLVRLKILLADPKLDVGLLALEPKVSSLLRAIASEWKQGHIRAVYLEKVVAMCREHNNATITTPPKSNVPQQKKPAGKARSSAKAKGNNSSHTSAGKAEDGRQLSSRLLCACLDIFTALAEVAPRNSFLTGNSPQLNQVLTSCFSFAKKREEVELRSKLKSFVVRILTLPNSENHIEKKVLRKINVLLEKFLVDSEVEYRKTPSSTAVSESTRHGSSRMRQSTLQDDSRDDGVALFSLEVLKAVSKVKPLFFRSFSSSMLSLLTTIVKRHTVAASARQKQGGASYTPQAGTFTISQRYKTPVAGILAEIDSANNPQLGSTASRSNQAKEVYPSKELKEFDQSLRAAVIILEILGGSDMAYTFSQDRKTLYQTLSTILDSSNNVHILMATVRIVGRWLSADSSGPLTLKERNSFLWKIASFDFNGLGDVVSVPLADLVSHYVIALLCGWPKGISGAMSHPIQRMNTQQFSDSDEMIIRRSLAACLLTANYSLRDLLLSLYVSKRSCNKEQQTSPAAIPRIPARAADELLWQLFHSDFEGLGGRDWIVVFVELLLSNIRPLKTEMQNTEEKEWTRRRMPLPYENDGNKNKLDPLSKLFSEYKEFCDSMAAVNVDVLAEGSVLRTSLRRLVHLDSALCQRFFQKLLPFAWESIQSDGVRLKLVTPMESLLSRSFHSQFLKTGILEENRRASNVVRSFLKGASVLRPLPFLDTDMLVSLAESYNCWYEVLAIMEDQFMVLSSQQLSHKLSNSGEKLKEKILLAMRHCYRQMGESNIWTSLSLRSCKLPQTHRAASLSVHGKVDEAMETYTDLVELIDSGNMPPPSDLEMDVIEERWVALNREHCQTAVVAEYANSSKNSSLMLESAWKQRDWDRVRKLCSFPPLVADIESGEPSVKMCETLLAVADGKLSDVENLHAQTAQLCLYRWQLLPELSSGSMAHASLLHFFHRLVEIRESGQIMVETSNHSNGKTLPDLKNLLNAWRHRLPNDYEELALWDEIFTWRSHMFSAITSNFAWSEPSTLATLHDRPWTAIRMSMTARKQGMRQTALFLLNKLTDSRAMDVSDAYLKLREQILAYNNPENELERTGGLNLINTTNLSFFDAPQKGELFRLKAIFLSSLRRTSKSNQAYCHSVQICPTHAKAWISWGGLCSSLGTLTEKQAEQLAAKGGNSPENMKERAASSKKVAQYLAQAMGCYIEAVQIDRSEKARIHLPKCLWILTKDGSSPGVLCQTIENRGTKLPPWVWLPWIPQLLTGLCRVEGRAIKAILTRVVKAYPQAVYYSLRAFYLERRDVERAKGITSSSSQHMPSVAHAEEMMSTLRRSHASLWSSLEAILEELIVKFRPSYEEELLATISALLERAESHAEKQSLPDKARLEDEDAMVTSWSKTLSRIAAKFFRSADVSASSSRRDERVKKTAEFKRKYKADFEKDFKVSAAEAQGSPSTSDTKPQFRLAEYITRLQKWKRKLEKQVACTPTSLPLIESSHSLAMFAGDTPDLWPGACDTKYLSSNDDRHHEDEDEPGRNQSTTSSSAAIARKAAYNAALAAAKAAAREGNGGEYGGGSASIEIPGQYCPNSSTTADIKPCPELHTKLERFEPFVEVLRRNDQLVRRVGMVGSDGRVYRFLLQFAIPYWTRTDERTAQTNFIVDKFLRQNVVCARNHLSIQPSAAIPVAQRLRMTLDTSSRIALDDVYRSSCEGPEKKLEVVSEFFLKEVAGRIGRETSTDASQAEREEKEKTIRLDVYKKICSTKVDNAILLRHMQSILDDPESLYHFRRAFAGQLATNSLLQYAFSVAERTPQRFVILQSKAKVLSPDFRVSYSNQGFIEGQAIPFRMTPNIEKLIGQTYMEGRFIRSAAMVAGAIREHREEFDPILRLLMRDDILAWYSKSLAKTDSKTQELERQLIERVAKNVSTLHIRFSECAPNSSKASKEGPVDSRVRELCREASSIQNLSLMPTNYHGWL